MARSNYIRHVKRMRRLPVGAEVFADGGVHFRVWAPRQKKAEVVIESGPGYRQTMEGAAIDFVRDAFGHLKAIAADKGGHVLLKIANLGQDSGVVDASDKNEFIAMAKKRQWDREKLVRTLA